MSRRRTEQKRIAACGLSSSPLPPGERGERALSRERQNRTERRAFMKDKSRKKVRYAVVGLGWFAQEAALPAFANARDNSELAALVTGDPTKAKELSKKYGVPAVSYDDYDSFLAGGKVDAVYIALPNSHHREYTARAARAGIHVLCEK